MRTAPRTPGPSVLFVFVLSQFNGDSTKVTIFEFLMLTFQIRRQNRAENLLNSWISKNP